MLVEFVVIISFARIYIILLCSWSYGVLLWEMETGGMSSFLGVFLHSFVYPFNLIALPLFSSLPLFDVVLNYLPQVAMLFQSHAMLIFLHFLFLFVCLFLAFAFHIFTTRPQTISWLDNHRIDVRVAERLPIGKAQWMFGCNVRFHSFICAFIHLFKYLLHAFNQLFIYLFDNLVLVYC